MPDIAFNFTTSSHPRQASRIPSLIGERFLRVRRLIEIALIFALMVAMGPQCATADEPADNWHQWRGPNANGVSKTAAPPITWSETQNIKWKVTVPGQGTSTPIIWGDSIFLLTAINTGVKDKSIPDPEDQPKSNFFDIKRPNTQFEYVVLCLDRKTGAEKWRDVAVTKIPHEGAHNDNDFASASPTTDGKRLYCWFGSGGLYCYDLNGHRLWERDLGEATIESSLGEGCSPVVYQDKLVIVRDHVGGGSIEVFDSATGATVWKRERAEKTAWATPLVTEYDGKPQVITAASEFVKSYDLATGELIWKCDGLTSNVIPCPVRFGDDVICMSGYKGYSAISIPLTETGDLSERDVLSWSRDRNTPYIPSPVLAGNQLFFNQSNQSIVTCVDADTGEVTFGPVRLNELSNIYASPIGSNDHLFILGRDGKTAVLSLEDDFEVVAVNELDERFDASPALAGNQIFLRGEQHLYCIEEE